MAINFKTALGVHPQALLLREKRGEILASNLANADTPDYKARDLDFTAVLNKTLSSNKFLSNTQMSSQEDEEDQIESFGVNKTSSGHLDGQNTLLGATVLYRQPQQASLDGNTVEGHIEQAKYSENSVQYEASLNFIKGEFSDLILAIKGQ